MQFGHFGAKGTNKPRAICSGILSLSNEDLFEGGNFEQNM
jgi:hypothetical protein